jgi:hypothetical protein
MFIPLFTIKGYETSLKVVLCQTRVYRLFCIGFPGPNMLLQNRFVYRVVCNMGYAMAKELPQSAFCFLAKSESLIAGENEGVYEAKVYHCVAAAEGNVLCHSCRLSTGGLFLLGDLASYFAEKN